MSSVTAFPGSATDGSSLTGWTGAVGNVAWASDASIGASDGSYATCATTSSNDNSNILQGTNFGFSSGTLSGATLNGLVCTLIDKMSSTGHFGSDVVQFMKGAAATGGQVQNFTASTSNQTITYGSSSSMSGGSYVVSDITGSGFGAAYQSISASGNCTISIDSLSITVYYTAASPPGQVTGLTVAPDATNPTTALDLSAGV